MHLSLTLKRILFSLEELGLAGVLESAFVVVERCGEERHVLERPGLAANTGTTSVAGVSAASN